ncbi:MAG: hypothetical protein EPN70_11465 [Paraburkholderia sp.]|nr:MAG: hypothetical protein EPN70_11465 [Paraburkholderia sp.]TAM32809.1 MAG: hypothetical protein EPN59_00100 [Paraburkholderia sp.]
MSISPASNDTPASAPRGVGRVSALRGAIVDVVFEAGALPPVEDALSIIREDGSRLTAEVEAHLDERALRALALHSTALKIAEYFRAEDRLLVQRARRLQRFLTQPFPVTEVFSELLGRSVAMADTLAGCKAILAGECDDWQERSPYVVGTLDEAHAKERAQVRTQAAGASASAGTPA